MSNFARARAYLLVARHLGAQDPESREKLGLRYLGTAGGNHVLRDREGRLYGADLVINQVVRYVGIAPAIDKARN